ncbi:MAG: M48 family metalloprotease [Deltaproteobacteria bacterium]|nr:M48 family metalloprotease [Deltaproteobacteria bacterium]MCL4873876.1 M48 family metalloprotease [bacterium]
MRRATCILLLALFFSGCAATKLAPVTGPGFTKEEDEKRLWTRSEEEQAAIGRSDIIYRDKELDSYLNGVAAKLQPPGVYKLIPFKIVVIRNPYCNAFAYPNGAIYVHTGILSRMENEAQLATLLAHEMSHSTHRHQISGHRSFKNKAAFNASMRSTLGSIPAVGELTNILGDIGTAAAVTGHSRELESEADMEGLKLVIKAGYKAEEAPKLFEHIKAELEEEDAKEPFFFGSHPRLQDRIRNYNSYLKAQTGLKKGVINAETFRKKTAGAVLENAFLDLKAGRFKSALRGGEKFVSIRPGDPRGHYLMGEALRQRGDRGDAEAAEKHFRKALSANASYADAHKGLGLVYYKSGKKAKARDSFTTYLKLAPDARDRSYIQDYIAQSR